MKLFPVCAWLLATSLLSTSALAATSERAKEHTVSVAAHDTVKAAKNTGKSVAKSAKNVEKSAKTSAKKVAHKAKTKANRHRG